jgi:LysM repeat protein
VSTKDTLAGIAIKYNVSVRDGCWGRTPVPLGFALTGFHIPSLSIWKSAQVADIKRFNGLLSDTAMYARDVILVPTKLYPVG